MSKGTTHSSIIVGVMASARNKWLIAKQWKNQTTHKLCCQFYLNLVETRSRGFGEEIPGSLKPEKC